MLLLMESLTIRRFALENTLFFKSVITGQYYAQFILKINSLEKDRPGNTNHSAHSLDWEIIPFWNLLMVTDVSVLPVLVIAY